MPEQLTIINDEDEKVVASRKDATQQLEIADSIIIDSADMNELANETLSAIHEAGKELEARKATVLDPLNAAVKATRALFKPAEESLELAKTRIKGKIARWLDDQEFKRQLAERAAQARQREDAAAAEAALEAALLSDTATEAQREEAIANLVAAETAPAGVVLVEEGDMGSNFSSKTFEVEINDLPALLRYLADDLASATPRFPKTVEIKIGELKKFGNATKGTVTVPGVRFVQQRKVTARAM